MLPFYGSYEITTIRVGKKKQSGDRTKQKSKPIKCSEILKWLSLVCRVDLIITSCAASFPSELKMSNNENQKENLDQVSRLVSRLAEFKLTQAQTPPQEKTATRKSVSTQTVVPTAAQLAEVERVLMLMGEPIPTEEYLVQITTKMLIYHPEDFQTF